MHETLRYLRHADDPSDRGHRDFLERRLATLFARLERGARGLDFGSGRAGTLAALLTERGYTITSFDPCFAPNGAALLDTYDFVTCTEVVEHFHEPRSEFALIARLLRPGSHLAITTALVDDDTNFASWWYARDATHVSFYRSETMFWIADRFRWEIVDLSQASVLFVSR